MYTPTPKDRFTFGLWTVGNRGRDPFGTETRPPIDPVDTVHMLAEIGAWGVNLHDNDLVPIDATPAERDAIVSRFQKALSDTGHPVCHGHGQPLFDPIFKDGAFTSNVPESAATRCGRRSRPSTSAHELGGRSSSCGAAAKAPRSTPPGIPWMRSSGFVKPSTIFAST